MMVVKRSAVMIGDAASAGGLRIAEPEAQSDDGSIFGRLQKSFHEMVSKIGYQQEQQEPRQSALPASSLNCPPAKNCVHKLCCGGRQPTLLRRPSACIVAQK